MFKGSKNVEPEAHTSMIASVGGQSNAYTTDDETVFWETVPAQYLPLALWLEADRMATLRIDKDTLRQRARGGEGRAADARRQPAVRPAERDHLRPGVHGASLQAPDDRQHGGSRGGVGRRRARFLQHLLRAGERDAGARRRFRHRRRRCSWSRSISGRVPKAERPVPRDIPKEPPQTQEKRVTLQEPWPLPAVVVAYHITYDGNPDSYPLHIASKVLSDGQSSRIYKKLVYEKQIAVAAFGERQPHRGSRTCSTPSPSSSRGTRRRRRPTR